MGTYVHRLFRWVYRRPLNEPKGLYRIFGIGVLVIFIGTLATVLLGVRQGLWEFSSAPTFRAWSRCQEQQAYRESREQILNGSIGISEARLSELNQALKDPHHLSFTDARTAISIEEKLQLSLKREKRAIKVQPLREFLPNFIVGLVLTILFTLVVARLAASHGLASLGVWSREEESENWHKPYWSWVAIIFSAHAAREIFTSILETRNKSWFAWSSFCVSSEAWILMLVAALGVAMVVAYPATILWHFGTASIRPATLDPAHKDGRWGVGSYILFLQTWATLSLIFLVLPVALWLRTVRNDPRLSPAYLLTSSVLFASGLVITGRMIGNAIAIRRIYQNKLEALGETWQEIQDKKAPPDPTINFLGEHWWKLPTVIIGMFAFLWLILEQIGVSDFLVEITGMK